MKPCWSSALHVFRRAYRDPAITYKIRIRSMWSRYGLRKTLNPTRPSNVTRFYMAWMYILECSDGTYYVGSTKDLEYRFYEHQTRKGAKYTSRRLPVKLVYSEEQERIVDAYTREKQVQNWSRAKREALINGNKESLPKLAKKDFEKRNINKEKPLVE